LSSPAAARVEPDAVPPRGFWAAVGRQLHHPEGSLGSFAGYMMALINTAPNRAALDALKVHAEDIVLEFGFGPGHALKALTSQAREGCVYGIDQSECMLQQARHRNRAAIRTGRLKLLKGGFHPLPFADATFDRILAVNAAYFFDEDGRDSAELYRVLKPGGQAVIYVTDRHTMQKWPFVSSGHHRLYDCDELSALFVAAGFRHVDIAVFPLELPFGTKGLLGIAKKADRVGPLRIVGDL
jgi:SAM-dependent methyltransferase